MKGSELLANVFNLPRYSLRKEHLGGWSVLDLATEDVANVSGIILRRLDFETAQLLAKTLNKRLVSKSRSDPATMEFYWHALSGSRHTRG